MADLKVTFPEPCTEPWEGMAEIGCNRHCASCDRIVHDLAKMTVDEAEALLDSEERLCVRAEIGLNDTVKTHSSTRAIVVGAGAMLLAACQTTPGGRVEDGHRLSGTVSVYSGSPYATISNNRGDTVGLRVGQDGRFDVHGLRPGSYTLRFTGHCSEPFELADVVIGDSDVDLGRLPWASGCIIVGHVVREDPPRNV